MLIGNIFQQVYSMVDSIVVGRFVDSTALAAVGATSSLIFLIFGLTFGLSAGISIVISQYFGAKDYDNVRKGFATATYIILGASIIMGIVGFFSTRWLLELLNTDQEIIAQSEIYMKISYAGILGIACYNGMAAILRALGDSTTPLIFLILASVLNVILDLLFVIVLHWGVPGVAIATIISQIISAVGCVIYAIKKVKVLRMPLKDFKPDRVIFNKCIRLGIPVALQNSFISMSLMGLQAVINSFNVVVVAAYTATSRLEQLVLQPGMSVGAAVAAYSGQNMGAGDIERVKKGFRSGTIIILAFSICMLPIIYFGGEYIMRLFTKKDDIDVIKIGVEGIRINSFFYSAVGMIFITRNFLSGTGDIHIPMVMGITEVICRLLFANVISYYFGYYGIWWATSLCWFLTSFVGIFRYTSGKWEYKSIVSHP
jgi:putative MATE family efflux protein